MSDLFDRLDRRRPAPVDEKTKQPDRAQEMLDWLQRWSKPTVNSREISQFAPRSIRFDRENAIKIAETLVRHGWLAPLQTRQRNWREWQVIRKEAVVRPKIIP